MGTKYSTTSISGYNSSPPTDAGTAAEENRITWAKHKTKLSDPIKTALESIDTKLVSFADSGPVSKGTTYTTVAGDHLKTIEATSTFTLSLLDAATAGAGYTVGVSNQGSGTITVSRATVGDTINGTAGDVTIVPKNSLTFRVNVAANGYDIIDGAVPELAGVAKTDSNFLVGDGTSWVAESGATARTSLGLGSIATQAASSVSITGGTVTGITDITVADGGTGASSFTDAGVLIGNGTGAIQVTSAGTSGQVLTSNGAGVDPTFQAAPTTTAATQAQQETGSSTSVMVTPGRQHYHDSAAKAWVNFTGTGTVTINASYNVTSITDSGTGTYVVNITNALSSGSYCSAHSGRKDSGSGNSANSVGINKDVAPTASALALVTYDSGTSVVDLNKVNVAIFGDL